jgi:threonine dehydrogenase-like Zn-dependent dehydrogenase
MLACVVRNHALAVIRKPLPELRPGWALIRVRLAGICNTDVEILRGYHNFRGTPGHEFVGEVVDVRSSNRPGHRKRAAAKTRPESASKWLGRRVAGEINIACTALGYSHPCGFCRRGLRTHCTRRKVLGIVAHDGAFAEYLALPLENLHPVPEGVIDEQAVFIEPLAAACEIPAQIDLSRFERAAVLGDGKLAQLCARVLRVSGLPTSMFGKHAAKLARARRAGIAARRVGGISGSALVGERYPLVVEATGSPTGLALALRMTEPRGTLILKSTFHGAAPLATWPIVVDEINVLGSRCGPFQAALDLLQGSRRRLASPQTDSSPRRSPGALSSRAAHFKPARLGSAARTIDLRPLITRTFALAEAPAAIEFAQRPRVLKILLKP